MAEQDIDTLYTLLPDVFKGCQISDEILDDWRFVDINNPEKPSSSPKHDVTLENDDYQIPEIGQILDDWFIDSGTFDPNYNVTEDLRQTGLGLSGKFGSEYGGGFRPPPPNWDGSISGICADTLAFYLPFHYYYPAWWGVYLLLDGVHFLAQHIYQYAVENSESNSLLNSDCWIAARLYLFYHEIYHHNTESFGTRLEVSHRQPVYTAGMRSFYKKTKGTPECLEEGLAESNALTKVSKLFPDKRKQDLVNNALRDFVQKSPPEYRNGIPFSTSTSSYQNKLAEAVFHESFPNLQKLDENVWNSAKYAFRGFNDKAKGRAKYVIKRGSTLANRFLLQPRLRSRDLKTALSQLGCYLVRQGGNHEIWRCRVGKIFPIPRHPGSEIATGTLRDILKQAGINMGIEEFISKYKEN